MAGPIRQPIDIPALQRYIEQNVPDIKTPIEVKQFGFGQSNPTYLLTSPPSSSPRHFVIRKKPPGKLLSRTAHQVEREYQIIHALRDTDVPAPKTYCLCEDASVVGTPFYIMEFLDGRIITDPELPHVSAQEREEMWHDAVRTLAKLHIVDPKSVGLESFGRASHFYDRQIKTLSTISASQAQAFDVDTKRPVGPIPHFDDMIAFFRQHHTQPRDRSTLVHGDYKIDNMVFHPTEPRVIGVLDWEMATIGHPLSDLVNLTGPYASVTSAVPLPPTMQRPQFEPGATPGLPTISTILRWYAEAAGWDPTPEMRWGVAFGGLRGAVIMQGIAARYAMRVASGVTAKSYAELMGPYGEWGGRAVKVLRREEEERREMGGNGRNGGKRERRRPKL